MNVIKWVGGKRQLVDRLLPVVTHHLTGTYIEPFLGGGALALALPEITKVRAGDADVDLMTYYRCVLKMPRALAQRISAHAAAHSTEHYYAVRAATPEFMVDKAARFVYLNRACFNGLHRKNKAGQFNVPIGRGTPRFPSQDELVALSYRLRRWDQLSCGDFELLVNPAQRGDVIFADPPYDGTFTSYTVDGFSMLDQLRLSTSLHAAYIRGATILATNSDTEYIRHLYASWAVVTPVDERRRIAADGDKRADAACVLITAVHS